MKSLLICTVLLFLCLPLVKAQSGSSFYDESISKAETFYAQGQFNQALLEALMAYDFAIEKMDDQKLAQSCLLLSNINRKSGDYDVALDFGVRCIEYSRGVSEAYFVAGHMAMIQLYSEWGAYERQEYYIRTLMEFSSLEDTVKQSLKGMLVDCLYRQNRMEELPILLNELISYSAERGDESNQIEYVLDMVTVQRQQGRSKSALNYLQTVEFSKTVLDKGETAGVILNNLGELSLELGKSNEALNYFDRALRCHPIAPESEASAEINRAVVLMSKGRNEIALGAIDHALELAKRYALREQHNVGLLLKSRLLMTNGNVSSAIDQVRLGLSESEHLGDSTAVALCCKRLSSIYASSGNSEMAKEFDGRANRALAFVSDMGQRRKSEQAKKNATILNKERSVASAVVYSRVENDKLKTELATSQTERALETAMYQQELKEAELLNEQVAKEKAIKDLALVQAALFGEQQRLTILELEKEKSNDQLRFQELSFAKAQREKGLELLKKENDLLTSQKENQALEAKAQSTMRRNIVIALILTMLLLITVGLALWSARGKNKAIQLRNERIDQINRTLSFQHEEIKSSIEHARYFQEMIIPSEADLNRLFPGSFLVYRPMDIVSGDLPFLYENEGKVYVGAIDCIGHGVPAAMFAFIAYYNLRDLVNTHPTSTCADLLLMLHTRMCENVLGSGGTAEVATGVDIALFCYDKKSNVVQFAGANQPALIVSASETKRIKGDLFSVGDHSIKREVQFTNHVLSLEKGDRIMLFSDGLIHQFGGSDGLKKYSLKRLTARLEDLRKKCIGELKKEIEADFDSWKGKTSQTDDVMLIGIEITH